MKAIVRIQNKNHEMSVLSNGVLLIVHAKRTEIGISDVKEMQEAYNSLPDPKPLKAIQDFRLNVSMTTEAKKYAAKHSPNLLGVAYLINGLAERLFLTFYTRMWKRDKPTKFFENYEDAIEWLDSL
jgi:hypothetical protein